MPNPPDPPVAATGELRLIGFPGPFLDWGIAMARDMLDQAGIAHSSTDLFAEEAPPEGVRLRIGCGPDYPAAGAGVPTFVFLDDAAAAMGHLHSETEDSVGVARGMTATLAPLGRVLRGGNAVLVQPGNADEAAALLAARLLPGQAQSDARPPEPRDTHLPPLATTILDKLLVPMRQSVVTGTACGYELPLQCLRWRNDEQAVPVLDIVGPARALYYGPYYHFLPGDWRIELELFFSDDVGDASFAAELFAGGIISRARMRPGRGGLFRASFAARIEHPEAATEFRLWVERGVIEGRLGLRKVAFLP